MKERISMGKIDAYSRFWRTKVKEYGLEEGLDRIIDILKNLNCNDYFELGIGTGWPLASSLIDAGRSVYGCDLSAQSVLDAINDYPKLYGNVFAGTIDDCEKVGPKVFDCVYCIRSSWYMQGFPNNELRKMLSLTKPGGFVVFNIINKDSSSLDESIGKTIRNVIRFVVYRCICALKVIFLDEDYSGQMKLYFFSDREIRDGLVGCEIKAFSVNQLLEGVDKMFNPDSQKILYIAQKPLN